jgi:hypothetical protein
MTSRVEPQPSAVYICSVIGLSRTEVELELTPSDESPALGGSTQVRLYASLIEPWMQSQTRFSFVGQVVEEEARRAEARLGDWVIGFGPLATQIAMPASQCLPVPPSDVKASVGWALSLAVLRCVRSAGIQLGESVAILGYGLPGKLAAQFARLSGSTRVIVLSSDEACESEIGEPSCSLVTIEALESRDIPFSEQVDVLIDTVGDISLIQGAFPFVRQRGRALLMAPSYPSRAALDVYPEMHKRSIRSQVRLLDWDLSDDVNGRLPLARYLEAVRAFSASGSLSLAPSVQEVTLRPGTSSVERIPIRPGVSGLILRWSASRC